MSIEIEAMAPADAAQVSRLAEQVISVLNYYSEAARSSEISKYQPQCLLEMVSQDADSVLVAKDGDDFVGFCFNRYDDGIVWLAWFGVVPSYRKKGVGAALLSTLLDRVRAKGIHKVWCDSRTVNQASRTALKKAGFTEICEIANHWYGHDFVLLQRLLP